MGICCFIKSTRTMKEDSVGTNVIQWIHKNSCQCLPYSNWAGTGRLADVRKMAAIERLGFVTLSLHHSIFNPYIELWNVARGSRMRRSQETFASAKQMVGREDDTGGRIINDFMLISEPGVCFDESEKCREFAQQGKCTNSALHEYANFCRRSCGLCGRVFKSIWFYPLITANVFLEYENMIFVA